LSLFVDDELLGYIAAMASNFVPPPNEHGRFWQPADQRDRLSEEGRKWLDENAEAIKASNEWVAKNGLPLEKYRKLLIDRFGRLGF
jgi:hypothetical protein